MNITHKWDERADELLPHYIRWLIRRPGLSGKRSIDNVRAFLAQEPTIAHCPLAFRDSVALSLHDKSMRFR